MRITLYQQDIVWRVPEANYAKIEKQLQAHEDSDLLVLPEMCTTGFDMKPHTLETHQDVVQRLTELAARYGTAICGTFAIEQRTSDGHPSPDLTVPNSTSSRPEQAGIGQKSDPQPENATASASTWTHENPSPSGQEHASEHEGQRFHRAEADAERMDQPGLRAKTNSERIDQPGHRAEADTDSMHLEANGPAEIVRYNRCYFVQPDGTVAWSDKRHPFSPGGEGEIYRAGHSKIIVNYGGIRFLPVVCYDLRFPVWLRNTSTEAYDVLICTANWPAARQFAWQTLLAARAIENQTYVIGVNRVGEDLFSPYRGGTCAIHPYGHVLALVDDFREAACTFEPDMAHLADFRRKFPAWRDGDVFSLD